MPPHLIYVTSLCRKLFIFCLLFLCVSTFEKVVREGKNMAFSLCLADEERLAETVKAFPCLYDKTKKGYKEKMWLQMRGIVQQTNSILLKMLS